jgi:hypothetical protein
MDELYYLYALTWADCPPGDFGPGLDARYAVELAPCGRIAALVSRVGTDKFDVSKFQSGTADLAWVSKMALRHNEIVQDLARRTPVLPLRLAVLFRSKSSLLETLERCEAQVVEFLRSLGDRQEWAVKVYLDRPQAERSIPGDCSANPRDAQRASGGAGTAYLAQRRQKLNRSQQLVRVINQEVKAVEAGLQPLTDAWHRLRTLSPELTARPEKMVWNGAFLVSKAAEAAFRDTAQRLRTDLGGKGLIVEASGPWPPYHFCPALGQ